MSDPRIAELLNLLGQARTLLDELDVTITRQDVAAAPGGGTGGAPWPFDLAASDARTNLLDALHRFTLGTGHGKTPGELVEQIARAAYRQPPERLDDRLDELKRTVRRGWQAIDRRPDRRRIGRCDCGADVLARDDQALVRCRYCGAEHDANEQRARLIASARGIEVTIGGAVDAFKALGVTVTRGQVEGWVRRGHVKPSGISPTLLLDGGTPYVMGDLMAAWERTSKRRLPGTPGTP